MFKHGDSSSRQKMRGYPFQQILRQNVSWFLSYHRKMDLFRGFIFKPTETSWVPLKTELGIFKIALRLKDRHVFM